MTLEIEIPLFEGFDELDAIGPYEVLKNGAREGRADLTVATATEKPVESVTAGHGLEVVPDGTLGDPDLLLVPGGGWTTDGDGVRAVVDEGTLPERVAAHHAGGGSVASVCTGAMVLARAGVLEGRPATTHHVAHDDLAAVTDRVDARVVDAGDVLTAGGVTAGLDLAVYLLEREFGADVADQAAHEMEYERSRDVHRV